MKREKKLFLIVTFKTNNEAMKMDSLCPQEYGKLIPLPQEISAGCGLSWKSQIENKEFINNFLKENDISYEEITYIAMYDLG